MTLHIAVLKERVSGEKRVAMVPSVAVKLVRLGGILSIEADAGRAATFADSAYHQYARVEADTKVLVSKADVVLGVQPPPAEIIQEMKSGAVLVSFLFSFLFSCVFFRAIRSWLQFSRNDM